MSLRLMSAIIPIAQPPKPTDPDQLLAQLLECVQACQKRFGGKTELATEFDGCVIALCLTFESVFLHGVRHAASQPQNALQHVSTFVSSLSLNATTEAPTFWPFISQHLTKHEQERYEHLKHVWTDTGRGRAWIRSALNERSLERYLVAILGNEILLEQHYEPGALLRDAEKASLLPNMAAGVATILFAINIDQPELNSGVYQRLERIRAKTEPIVESGSIGGHVKNRRKVAKQFISFDEDEDLTFQSCSLPTSATIREAHVMEKAKIVTSQPSGEVPEVLTPITCEIGELKPISVERFVQMEETPTDISTVLGLVEVKSNELIKLHEENAGLREQVQKYLSAIRMLRNEDKSVQEALQELKVPVNEPDYQFEAKIYEQKLVQVAEMHAELIDFNARLQKSILVKDGVLERYRSELEALRGPMEVDEDVDRTKTVNVWIPSAFLTGSGSNAHHVYQIFLKAGGDEWNIYRRYSEFNTLYGELKRLDPKVGEFDFPPKKSIGRREAALVEERRRRLQVYLRRVVAHWPELAHCNCRFMLEQHLAFFKDQKDNEQNERNNGGRRSIFSSVRNSTSDNHYTGL